jgi:hypothetical protein
MNTDEHRSENLGSSVWGEAGGAGGDRGVDVHLGAVAVAREVGGGDQVHLHARLGGQAALALHGQYCTKYSRRQALAVAILQQASDRLCDDSRGI